LAYHSTVLAGGSKSCATLLDEVLHQLVVGEVLSGHILGVNAGHQTSLAIDNVGGQAAFGRVPQAVDKKLQVDNRCQHADDLSVGGNWCTHQHHGALAFSGAY